MPGVSLSVGAWSFLDTEITGDLIAASGANLKGRQGAFAPDISGNIAINWETSLNDSLMLSVSSNIAYQRRLLCRGGSLEPFDALPIHLVTSLKTVTQLLTLIYQFILLMKAGRYL